MKNKTNKLLSFEERKENRKLELLKEHFQWACAKTIIFTILILMAWAANSYSNPLIFIFVRVVSLIAIGYKFLKPWKNIDVEVWGEKI